MHPSSEDSRKRQKIPELWKPVSVRDLAQGGKKVGALELAGEWADVRDPETLAKLNR